MILDSGQFPGGGQSSALTLGGFACGTEFATVGDTVSICELRVDHEILDRHGQKLRVIAINDLGDTSEWVQLPGLSGASPVIVAASQLLVCRHFLCAAMFGQSEVLIRAGDLTGTIVQEANGGMRQLRLPLFDRNASLSVSGYEFICTSFRAGVSHVSEPDRVSTQNVNLERYPQSLSMTPSSCVLTRTVLGIDEARQLRDAGVLFRAAQS